MRQELRTWIADADTRHNLTQYGLHSQLPELNYQDGRAFDLYITLVGELFDFLRNEPGDTRDWSTLGNAFSQIATQLDKATLLDAKFFSAAAFYNGGFSASAYLAMKTTRADGWQSDVYRACYDFLARSSQAESGMVGELRRSLLDGAAESIEQARRQAAHAEEEALERDPSEWVAWRVYSSLLSQFARTNIRAVLPAGSSPKWDPLVSSFISRSVPVWDFFPSQIAAISAGLLTSEQPFSLQMPTGAGKTALTETLLFSHLTDHPNDVAILLVPYRSLARELRYSVATRLSSIGLPTRTVYGGTVPTQDEAQDLDRIRAIIATPEALTGLLGRAPELLPRIALIVCDEGHLLDSAGRGVGLELLLARFLGREADRPRTVFISAIVPNIEDVNAWLGGSDQSVVRSTFRPADAEYAVLRPTGKGLATQVGLEMRAVDSTLAAHTLSGFLRDTDFRFTNPKTRRTNTYTFTSIKTQAIAAARKSLLLGTVAVFSATKTGNQGVIGLANELLSQLAADLPLPRPLDMSNDSRGIDLVSDYLTREFGSAWVGTQALRAGTVVHHGDIPQETREALEELLGDGKVRLVLCTSTLAEGVNLPIRTLILYAVQRRSQTGRPIPMLARDIRNLVGRAGRAGSSTKGLVICANPKQWVVVAPVASDQPGEDVHGALRELVERLQDDLRRAEVPLSNEWLERITALYPLTDGVDSTLLELLHDDVGDEQFRDIAATLAAHTFAANQLDRDAQDLLVNVFTTRATRLSGLRTNGRLAWVRETGARVRLVDSVVADLAPRLDDWESVDSPLNYGLLNAVLTWAYTRPEFKEDLAKAFTSGNSEESQEPRLPDVAAVLNIVRGWVSGDSFAQIASTTNRTVDQILRIHGSVISYSLATLIEQAIAVLQRYMPGLGVTISDAVTSLPEYLRYGVSTPIARTLMTSGLRHRRAAVLLAAHPAMTENANFLRRPQEIARGILTTEDGWRESLGEFVFERTLQDLENIADRR